MDSSLHNSTISSAQKVAPSVKAFRLYGWKNVNRAITFFFRKQKEEALEREMKIEEEKLWSQMEFAR